MIFGQARSRSVLMGLDNHMITGTVPALLSGYPCPTPDMTPRHSRDRRTGRIPFMQCPWVWNAPDRATTNTAGQAPASWAGRLERSAEDAAGA